MKIKTLKKDNKKKIIIVIIVIISIELLGIFTFTFAKSKNNMLEESMNYKSENTNNLAFMIENDKGEYEKSETIPESGYVINEEKSYCYINNSKEIDKEAILKTIGSNHVFSNLSKNEKCYLYFDKSISAQEVILANVTVNDNKPDIAQVAIEDEGVFKAEDNDGTSYYYRGAATNNYLRFAGFWWRIVRINGDGTIRLIYDGTEYHANGTSTSNSIAISNLAFNINSEDNAYVGFMYGATGASTYEKTHANINKSNILKELETWYKNNLISYAKYIDENAGFCGSRESNTNSSDTTVNGSGGTAKVTTYYLARYRLYLTHTADLRCNQSNDLYTFTTADKGNKSLEYPIGLISSDEVNMAGGIYGSANSSYYMFNGQAYWTMSPNYFNANANVCFVDANGKIYREKVTNLYGVRPVINLKSNVAITGSGTQNDPYEVN